MENDALIQDTSRAPLRHTDQVDSVEGHRPAPTRFQNVFVLCTGRCGSVSFTKACEHFTNYTSGHETRHRQTGEARVDFQDHHIEVDNRLAWFLGRLQDKYGDDAFYVHLIRDEQQVAESYDRRWHSHGSLIHGFDQGILRHELPNDETAAELVRTINENIRCFLRDKSHTMTINLDDIKTQFPEFARRINATGDIEKSLELFGERHNATNKNAAQQSKQSLPIVRLTKRNQELKKENRFLRLLAIPSFILLLPLLPLIALVHRFARPKQKWKWSLASLLPSRRKRRIRDAYLAHHAQDPERAMTILGDDAPTGATELFRALSAQSDSEWLVEMNDWAACHHLPRLTFCEGPEPRFHRMQFESVAPVPSPEKVTVIMPAFNAEETIEKAVQSILAQSWQNLELIIVDDCSTDKTAKIAARLAATETRIRVLRNAKNVGPYVSKNRGLQVATGRYITGHDADDIAVPTRIADQMAPILRNPECSATIAYMLRIDDDAKFSFPSKIGGYSYDGMARKAMISLLIDREVLDSQLGYWDGVRFGGDSEMLRRVSNHLGSKFQEIKKITMLCLDVAGSLTNNAEHGVTFWNGVSPIRRQYRDSWSKWHDNTPIEEQYLPFPHFNRNFDAPDEMLVSDEDLRAAVAWSAYDDVAQQNGGAVERSKTPVFSSDNKRRIGIVTYWFNRGQAIVSRKLRAILEEAGIESHILARPTKSSFVKPTFVDRSDIWRQERVTAASRFLIPGDEYLKWAAENRLDTILFDQNLQFSEILMLRCQGIQTIGRFVWEDFGPRDVPAASQAFDIIYSLTHAERRRYQSFGIDSPRVRWGCPTELVDSPKPARNDDEVRFFYPGGYLTQRKPTAEVIRAFRGVSDPRARLIIKAQHPNRGKKLAMKARKVDRRIQVVIDDLPAEEHYRLMASNDVCLAPTRWEGLGLHHSEAIALGMPTITNDFAPMNEYVTHGVDGWLIPAVWREEKSEGVPRLETPVGALREAIEKLCDDDCRQELVAGVETRKASLDWTLTQQDVIDMVTGKLAFECAQ